MAYITSSAFRKNGDEVTLTLQSAHDNHGTLRIDIELYDQSGDKLVITTASLNIIGDLIASFIQEGMIRPLGKYEQLNSSEVV